eukprot:8893753-Pyramimonas_sp.AAC.1
MMPPSNMWVACMLVVRNQVSVISLVMHLHLRYLGVVNDDILLVGLRVDVGGSVGSCRECLRGRGDIL